MRIMLAAVVLLSIGCITIERPIIIEPQRCECVQDPVEANDACPDGALCGFTWKLNEQTTPCCPNETATYPCVACRPFDNPGLTTDAIIEHTFAETKTHE